MGNETDKDLLQQQQNPSGGTDQSKKNPSQNFNQQDPSKKNPSQTDDSRQRDNQESSDQEKRRAS